MAGKRPDYEVFVSRSNGEGEAAKTYYTKVGAAWNVAKDGISIELHALPTDGRLVMFPRKEDNSE